MIVLIFHGEVIIVIHKRNVFNYIAKQEDQDQYHLQLMPHWDILLLQELYL